MKLLQVIYTFFFVVSNAPFGEIDQAVENSDPVETVKALKTASAKNQMPYVFTDIKYANLYHEALKNEKEFSMPSSAVVSVIEHRWV